MGMGLSERKAPSSPDLGGEVGSSHGIDSTNAIPKTPVHALYCNISVSSK